MITFQGPFSDTYRTSHLLRNRNSHLCIDRHLNNNKMSICQFYQGGWFYNSVPFLNIKQMKRRAIFYLKLIQNRNT
jgi:hypothetical protein